MTELLHTKGAMYDVTSDTVFPKLHARLCEVLEAGGDVARDIPGFSWVILEDDVRPTISGTGGVHIQSTVKRLRGYSTPITILGWGEHTFKDEALTEYIGTYSYKGGNSYGNILWDSFITMVLEKMGPIFNILEILNTVHYKFDDVDGEGTIVITHETGRHTNPATTRTDMEESMHIGQWCGFTYKEDVFVKIPKPLISLTLSVEFVRGNESIFRNMYLFVA